MMPQLKTQGRREFLVQALQLINNRAQKSSKFLKFVCISWLYRNTSRFYGSEIYSFVFGGWSRSKPLLRLSPEFGTQNSYRASFDVDKSKALQLVYLLKPELIRINFSADHTDFFTKLITKAPGKVAIVSWYAKEIFPLLEKHAEKVSEVNCDVLHIPEDARLPSMKLDHCNISFCLMMEHKTPITDVEQQLRSHYSLKYHDINVVKGNSQSTVNLEVAEKFGPLNFTLKVTSEQVQ